MKWIKNEEIDDFLSKHNYDIKISGNARWIDQKCTPDVVTIVSDCILSLVEGKEEGYVFNSADVWHYEYTKNNVSEIFKKPSTNYELAKNEYDKFFSQPLEMLAYSKVLTKIKRGNRNYYFINNLDILIFLSLREMNSLFFLNAYCEKVLKDSGIWSVFDTFFENPNKKTYNDLKNEFVKFCIEYTNINKALEPRRIFTKILNPLSYSRNKPGSLRGSFSKNIITYDMLMYNRDNFRDMYQFKPKNLTRKEHNSRSASKSFTNYLMIRAKKQVRMFNNEYNNGHSEVYDENNLTEIASNIHHIFPKEEFPEISHYHENLIALTPTQHYNYAHINGNTRTISKDYQFVCLIAKTHTIKESYELNLGLYEFFKYLEVLSIGLSNELYLSIPYLDFDEIVKNLNLEYNDL